MESSPASASAIVGLLILLPGFVSLFVERLLAYEREQTGVVFVSKALVYSFINYLIFSAGRPEPLALTVGSVTSPAASVPITLGRFDALFLALVSLATGVIGGAFKAHNWHMMLAQRLGLTLRTSRTGLWSDIFYDFYLLRKGSRPYLKVFLKDGRRIYGLPHYFAHEYGEGPVLFLANAVWISGDQQEEIPDPGIVVNGSQIDFIQFYAPETEGAQ